MDEPLAENGVREMARGLQRESRRLERDGRGTPVRAGDIERKLAAKDAEIEELRELRRAGRLSEATAVAGITAAERDRETLRSSATRQQRQNEASVVRALPEAAALYRKAVADIAGTLKDSGYRQAAKAMLVELLGGPVPVVRREGGLVALLRLDKSLLIRTAGNSSTSKLVAGVGFEPTTFGL